MTAKRRLTKTAVRDAVRETRTTQFVDTIGQTFKKPDGRHEVCVRLFDTFDDPRSTPAGAALIGTLEESGWAVTHRGGRRFSVLTVYEPVTSESSSPEQT